MSAVIASVFFYDLNNHVFFSLDRYIILSLKLKKSYSILALQAKLMFDPKKF